MRDEWVGEDMVSGELKWSPLAQELYGVFFRILHESSSGDQIKGSCFLFTGPKPKGRNMNAVLNKEMFSPIRLKFLPYHFLMCQEKNREAPKPQGKGDIF
jgi:hypothetical protein